MTSSYASTTLIWDYRNRVSESNTGSGTSTYAYDHTNQRVKKVFGGTTTHYPNMYFNKAGATTTTRHIFDNQGGLVALIEGNGTATSTYYVHTDHLGGTNVTTNASGTVVQTLDYYPYGAERVDTGTDVSQRQFIGQEFDEETDLSYLNARYYSGDRGQFLSQDPVFWEVGQTNDGKKVLGNPPLQNSYSYGANNPITHKDPEGRLIAQAALLGVAMYGPQIMNYLSSLMTPLGQITIGDAVNDIQSGNYGWAAIGLLTPGDGSSAKKYEPVFDGLWSVGKMGNRSSNATHHAFEAGKQGTGHAAEFGFKSVSDYVKGTREFITNAINNGLPAKISTEGSIDVIRTYDRNSNTFAAFELNRSTNAITPRTMFQPHGSAESYFDSQRGKSINLKSLFNN